MDLTTGNASQPTGRGIGLLVAILVSTALAGCGSATQVRSQNPLPAGPTRTPSPSPSCPAAGVAITSGATDAAMGLRVQDIELTNCGTTPYVVNGYPALRVLDADRNTLDIQISKGSSTIAMIDGFNDAAEPVTLQPGQQVVAGLVWRNTVTDSTVPAVEGRYLEVAPALGQPWQLVTPDDGIDLGNTGKLGVGAWRQPPR